MISLEVARSEILEKIEPLAPERVAIGAAGGRVLRERVSARESMPPFDNSAMDGFLVRVEDVVDACADNPIRLRVIAAIEAGRTAERALRAGEAYRIFTGAPIAPGPVEDLAVIPHENAASYDDNSVTIVTSLKRAHFIRRAGEDLERGATALEPGVRLNAAAVGLLAMVGAHEVSVSPRPRIAVHSSGNELIPVEEELTPGKIRNSNVFSIAARVRECGGVALERPVLRDDPDAVRAGLQETLKERPDAIVTTGGVSAGDLDFIREVARELGEDVTVRKVAMKPGKPLVDGTLFGVPFFGLPGNPAACLVSFEMFVRPALDRLEGISRSEREPRTARVDSTTQLGRPGRRKFLRGAVRFDLETNEYRLQPLGSQGSHILTSFATANCLVDIPAEQESLTAGEQVVVWPL